MLEDRLAKLTFRSRTFVDAIWHLLVTDERDPSEMLTSRAKQRAYMARYGGQSMLAWDEVNVVDFLEYYQAMADVVAAENKANEVKP